MKAKIGAAYLGIRTRHWSERLYSVVFLVRRMMYAILTVSCLYQPNILIHCFLFCNVLNVVYLGHANPNEQPLARRVEYFNEACLHMITYHVALFPLLKTLAEEELAGWSMIGFLGFIFVANLTVMIAVSIGGVKRKCKLKALKKKQMKAMEERR